MSLIIIEFELDKDTDTASQEVKDKLDLIINDLPSDAKIPVASKVDISASPVITLALSGDIDPAELYYLAKNNVKDRLSRLEGVGSVDILGGQKREVNVKFSKRTVYENNISLPMVAGILAKANMDMPGGNFQNRGQDYAVSLEGQLHSLRDVDSIMIPAGAGMRRLDQLALIEEGPEKARQRISFF
ncbi:acriflavin resistance protein, partial [candidate division KSB3 bacterium]